MSTTGSDTWKPLLREALRALDGLGRPVEWSFGSGTVLALRFEHRDSRDVDLFLSDPQVLTYLSPRLNDTTAAMTGDYVEQSASLKLSMPGGEIDFIVAPRLLGRPTVPYSFEGREVPADPTAEIVAKKLFYRAAGLKVRDVVDVAAALAGDAGLAEEIRPVVSSRAGALARRLDLLANDFDERVEHELRLRKAGRALVPRALGIVQAFVAALGRP